VIYFVYEIDGCPQVFPGRLSHPGARYLGSYRRWQVALRFIWEALTRPQPNP
jgi:hypothetical protein